MNTVQEELEAVKCYIRVLLDIRTDNTEHDQECENFIEWMKACANSVKDRRRFEPQLLAVTKMFGVMRECLLSYSWNDAFRVLKTIALRPLVKQKLTFLRVAMEIFHRMSFDLDQLSAYVGCLNQIPGLLRRQVCVDHFMFRLATLPSDFQWVEILRDLDNSLIIDGIDVCVKKTKRDIITETVLYAGFRALFLYVKFMRTKQEYSNTAVAAMTGAEQLTQVLNQQLELSLKAFQEFEVGCANEPGCWDIFISKYVELLNLQDTDRSRKKAEAVLKRYAKQNALNPNAWRFLYVFYTQHGYELEHRISALQELCECVPSDPLAVELYKLSLHGEASYGHECDPIVLFFNHLDYNMGDSKAWGIMAAILVTRSSQREGDTTFEGFSESVRDCWVNQNRNTWWPSYQFAPPMLSLDNLDNEECEKILFKATVAQFLLGLKNKFTVTAKDSLPQTKMNSEAGLLLKAAEHLPVFIWT